MNMHIDDISVENNYDRIVSAFATTEKAKSLPKGTEQSEMKDTASTSSLARMASSLLQRMRGESQQLRQEKIDKFKSLANEDVALESVLDSDEVADKIFSAMFG